MSAVEDAARERGYSVLLADGRRDPEREIESLEVLAEREVDGLIIASTTLTLRHQVRIREVPCPVVIVNSEFDRRGRPGRALRQRGRADGSRPSTCSAWATAAWPTWRRRRPTTGPSTSASRACVRSLREPGLSPSARSSSCRRPPGVDGGALAAVMAHSAPTLPSRALICSNDLTAIGAVRGLRSLGLAVPGEVSVVGFDDIEMAAHVDPPLTTVRQATDEMGHWAVASLLQRIDRGPRGHRRPGGRHARPHRAPARRRSWCGAPRGPPDEPV